MGFSWLAMVWFSPPWQRSYYKMETITPVHTMSISAKPASPPQASPIRPVELTLDSVFQFRCHKDIACFNACCRNIDLQLTSYDILRLKNRLGLTSSEFVGRYTIPFEMDAHGMPGLKMATKPGTSECIHLTEEGCSVYEDRPAACRYYALGNMAVRKKGSGEVEDAYFVVREAHCLGHEEPHEQTVAEYRVEQGLDKYDEMNSHWRRLILKKRSAGPTVGSPSERSLQLFDMCSYDLDSFREFVQSPKFREVVDLSPEQERELLDDEESLHEFAMGFLEQVLFGVNSVKVRPGAREKRIKERREVWDQRRQQQITTHQEDLQKRQYGE